MKIEIKGPFTRLVGDASLVQNSVTPYIVEFTFDGAWDGFAKTALFEAGGASIAVVLTDDCCTIPIDCLKQAGIRLQVAVVGTKGDQRISTGWCVTGMILHKASLGLGHGGGGSVLPDDAYEQIMAVIGDLGAAGFEGKTLSEVIIELKNNIADTATDKEVEDMLNTTFGASSTVPGYPEEENPNNTATDKEVDDLLDEVFGK